MLESGVDITQFKDEAGEQKYLPPVDLLPGNQLPISLRRICKGLGADPYAVLERWGIHDTFEQHSVIQGALTVDEEISAEQARASRRKPKPGSSDGTGS